ncbi:MAG: hypothetical protein KGL46_13610 [Hyphomicrobiales bacterium]|nr:hypothetical protein [Hyphomicrobiales bacterium]
MHSMPISQKSQKPAPERGWLLAFAVYAAVWAVQCYPWLSGQLTIPWDAKAHFYPQFVFLSRALHSGQQPFWTPNVFDGWPQIADPQSLIFSPFYFLAALLVDKPGMRLHDAILFGMLAMGAIALMLYGRDRGWRPVAALAAALAFTFGGSAWWRIQHVGQVMSLAWFPLALFCLSRALDRRSLLWGAFAGVASAFMVVGRDQIAWFQIYLLAGFILVRLTARGEIWRNLRGALGPLFIALVVGVALVAAPVAFTAALAMDSNRPSLIYSEVVKASLHPASLLTFVAPNFYGVSGPLSQFWGPPSPTWPQAHLFLARNMGEVYIGALPLVALIGAHIWRSDRDTKYFAVAATVLLIYALGLYTPGFAFLFHLPGADLWRRPADATFDICALLALIAGSGVDRIARGAVRFHTLPVVAALAALIAACVALAQWKDHLAQAAPALAMAAVFLGLSVALLRALPRLRAPAALVLTGALLCADFLAGAGPNESTALPTRDYAMLKPDSDDPTIAFLRERLKQSSAPDRRDRIEFAGVGFDWPNASLAQDFDNHLGYNPLRLSLFEALTNAGDHVATPDQRVFSKAFPSYWSLAADLVGLRYIATGVPLETIDPKARRSAFTLLARTKDAYIYENPRALPRVMVATEVAESDFNDILQTGNWQPVDFRRIVLLQQKGDARPRAAGKARILSYENTRVVVDAEAPEGGWLVLTDIYHPWWTCQVDGVAQPVLRANVAFRAVALSPGKHRVVFAFKPFEGLWAMARALAHGQATP